MGRLILVGGGARSGKSAFALKLACQLGQRRIFLATAEPGDAEMGQRITRHRQERGDDFETLEEPLDVPQALVGVSCEVVVLDCLTLWLSNLLCGEDGQIDQRVDQLLETATSAPWSLIVVTNEVGFGLVPESSLGRAFRDVCGRVHQRVAEVADEIYLAVLGTVVKLDPVR